MPKGFRIAANVDSNHSRIKRFAELCGAYVLDISRLKKAFDLLVFFDRKMYAVEVKDGEKSSSKQSLSEGEDECKTKVEKTGNKYHTITHEWAILEMLNLDILFDAKEKKRLQLLIAQYIALKTKKKNQRNKAARRGTQGAITAHEGQIKQFFIRLCKQHSLTNNHLHKPTQR